MNIEKLARNLTAALLLCYCQPNVISASETITNSLGMRLVRVPAGSFWMGNSNATPAILGGPAHLKNGDWDERPLHKVTISQDFWIGETWEDTGGRTGGRHTTFVPLKDGRILGIGGKNSDIDGYMPQFISADNGKTWQTNKTPFPALKNSQRPCVIRLVNGRLFFVSDFQDLAGHRPAEVKERGAFVALSEDEARTWRIKSLKEAQPHESKVPGAIPRGEASHSDGTLGYCVARQGPNGVIHLITSMNHPCQHFELNEAWILSDQETAANSDQTSGKTVHEQENYSDGKPRFQGSGLKRADGTYRMHGKQTWFYPSGRKQWEVTYDNGRKTGSEMHWAENGKVDWQWDHRAGGLSVCTQYWPNGQKRAESSWRNARCEGPATLWDFKGHKIGQATFQRGTLQIGG